MAHVKNQRSSLLDQGNNGKLEVTEWLKKYNSVPVDVPKEYNNMAVCLTKDGKVSLVKYVETITKEPTSSIMPFGKPIDYTSVQQYCRFWNGGVVIANMFSDDIGTEMILSNRTTLYAYIYICGCILRKIIYDTKIVSEMKKWNNILLLFVDYTKSWLNNIGKGIVGDDTDTMKSMLKRISVTGNGPDNLERAFSFFFLNVKPCLQQVVQLLMVSFFRTYRILGPGMKLTSTYTVRIAYSILCIFKYMNGNMDVLVDDMLKDLSEINMLKNDTDKLIETIYRLTGYKLTVIHIEDMINRAINSREFPEWAIESKVDGLSIGNISYDKRKTVSMDPPVITEEKKEDKLIYLVQATNIATIKQWTAFSITKGCFILRAKPHYKCGISESNVEKNIPEAAYRFNVDGKNYVMSRGYSSNGLNNFNVEHIIVENKQDRLTFDDPLYIDMEKCKVHQNGKWISVGHKLIIGFKNCEIELEPTDQQTVKNALLEQAKNTEQNPFLIQ